MLRDAGNDRSVLRSSSRSRPAIRFDSPSRSRIELVRGARDDGRKDLPADDDVGAERALLERAGWSRMISSSKVTRGVNSRLTPTDW